MGLNPPKIIRVWRLVLTNLLLFMLTWYYEVPERAWSLITVWFVMYEYETVGGVFNKSFLRFFGTVSSAIYGMFVVYFCGNNPVINMLALIPGVFVYAYYFMEGDKTYIGSIGGVTLTIVLLNYNDIDTAVIRVFNIVIGILFSMFMICFFYPQYARNKIIEAHLKLIAEMCDLLENYLDLTVSPEIIQAKILRVGQGLPGQLATLKRLISEASKETQKAPYFTLHASQSMEHIQRLMRLLIVFAEYFSSGKNRANPKIQEQLSQLLTNLKLIKNQFFDVTRRLTLSGENLLIQQGAPFQSKKATAVLLNDMLEETLFLNAEIKQLLSIYEVYEMKVHYA